MDKELIDKLLSGYKTPEDIVGENGLLKQLTKAIVERALEAELTTHLGYERHSPEGNEEGNTRNGTSSKPIPRGRRPAFGSDFRFATRGQRPTS